jgi:hypothetical protein
MNHLLIEIVVYFVSQPRYQYIDNVGQWIKTVALDMFDNHGFRDYSALIAHQIFEQGKLSGL